MILGNNKAAVEGLQLFAPHEEVQNLGRVVVHESVVHEAACGGWQVRRRLGIPTGVGRGQAIVEKVGEVGVDGLKLPEFGRLHEHHC